MYDPPAYIWAITIAATAAIAAATCVVLYSGAERAGLGRRRAALLAGAAAAVLGGWFTATAVIAGHGWYHTRLGHGVPWLPIAVAGFFGTLLALRRIPVVARALAAPGLASRLEYPHLFRVEGVVFLIIMALGHLPALFALPAGLGDIAAGIAAPLVAYRLARGTGRRAALWHNAFGMTDLVVALTLGALTGFQLLNVTPSAAPIFELPLALIVTAGVPLLLVLHITSMSALARAPRTPLPATGPLIAAAAPRTAVAETPAAVPGEALSAKEKTVQRKIDALKGRRPGPAPAGAPPSCPPASSWPPSSTRRAIRPQDCTPGVGPVNGKETQ